MLRHTASLLIAFALSSCASVPLPIERLTYRYTRKEQTMDFSAVGRLFIGKAMCTATFVDKRVILTAAHCVHKSSLKDAYFLSDAGDKYNIVGALEGPYDGQASSYMFDFALLLTDQDSRTGVIRVAKNQPGPGVRIADIGFGCDKISILPFGRGFDPEKSGKKRITYGKSEEISVLDYSSSTMLICFGDSGGPVIDIEHNQVYLVNSASLIGEFRGSIVVDRAYYFPAYSISDLVRVTPQILAQLPPGLVYGIFDE